MSTGLEKLKLIGEKKTRNSEGILKAGLALLKGGRLGDDSWEVREKVLLAALDEHDFDLADKVFGEIKKKFPESLRVKKLEGLLFEAKGSFKDAKAHYEKMKKDHPEDQTAFKRLACILKTQGHTEKALEALNTYVEVYQSDKEAWQELALLNVELGHYSAATFCYEELILHSPTNPFFYLACGESMYTTGGARNLLDARKYFSQSLVIRPAEKGNFRALFDVALVTSSLHEKTPAVALCLLDDEDPEEVEKMNRELNSFACNKLGDISKSGNMCSDLQKIVETVASDLLISKS